jgi:hypothetical protein
MVRSILRLSRLFGFQDADTYTDTYADTYTDKRFQDAEIEVTFDSDCLIS